MTWTVIQTPGPGSYNVVNPTVFKQKSPHYSMTSRNTLPSDGTRKPGPGAYFPETASIHTITAVHAAVALQIFVHSDLIEMRKN